jgi:cell fate regulator YaaT (PSP1 superfamily)
VTKRILHPATEEELEHATKQKEREPEVLIRSRAIARSMNLEMKLCEVEIQADSKKGTFFYTADQRVDFRELIRVYATDFKMKVEMKQIGARQESGKVGGIGSCGRELCCSTWLTDFKSVNTTAARYQNLSINQTKLSGQCGRLKCCLNYELDTYMDALSVFPDHVDHLETVKGMAHLQKKDIFKNLLWYSYSDNNKQYPLSIERVKEIKAMNKAGQKADELHPVEIESRESKGKVADMGYVNDVGQITLKALENKHKKKKHGSKGHGGQQNKPQANAGSKPQGGAPNKDGDKPQGGAPQQAKGPRQQGSGQPQQNKGQQNRPPQNKGQQGAPTEGKPQGQNPRPPQQQRQNQPNPNKPQQGDKPPGEGGQHNRNKRPHGNRPNRPQGERAPGGDAPKPEAGA